MRPQITELIIMEQFVQILPSMGQDWVCRQQWVILADATYLMENYKAIKAIQGSLLCIHWRRKQIKYPRVAVAQMG